MGRQPYTYVVLRYRHDPLAGELVNVGVLLHAPQGRFLRASLRKTYGRMSKLYPDIEGGALTADFRRFETAFRALEEAQATSLFSADIDAQILAKRVVDDPAGAYVWSQMGAGTTNDPQQALDSLFARYVTRYDVAQRARRSDADVWKPARDLLAERQLSAFFEPKVIRSSVDEVEFEHAWKNGIWHCVQPLSFDLADADSIKNKAARWVGHMHGISKSDEQVQAYFIVGRPTEPGLMVAFDRAIEFLSEAPSPSPPRVILEEAIPSFVDELEDEIGSHMSSA